MKKRYTFLPKNWFCFGLATVFTTAISVNLLAQNIAPVKQWDKTFGGNDFDELNSLQQTADGGYILGGWSGSDLSGDKSQANNGFLNSRDYWVVKLDAVGNKLWDKTFGGEDGDGLTCLQQTADGGYILGGGSDSGISGDKTQSQKGAEDFWILKINANGSKVWDKTFGGNGIDEPHALQQTSDGGYILGGISESGVSGDKSQPNKGVNLTFDYWILKLDANGNKIWDKTFGGIGEDWLVSLQQTSDGGYILAGNSKSGISGDKTHANQGNNDYWVVKLDASGNKIWDKTLGGNGEDYLYSLQQTSDGGFILGGYSESGISGDKSQASKGNSDYWMVKLDATGNKSWDKTYGGSGNDWLLSLQQTTDGGYILGGVSNSGISGDKTQASTGYWIIKVEPGGIKAWDKTFGSGGSDHFTSLQQTLDGSFILGGSSDSGINGDKTQICRGNYDYWILKLGAASPTGLKEQEASFNLSLSPNPNQGKFNLQLSNLTTSKAEVTITDLLGRVVLQKEIQTTNSQLSEELTLPNAKGIYLLQLKAGEQIITRKIVVE